MIQLPNTDIRIQILENKIVQLKNDLDSTLGEIGGLRDEITVLKNKNFETYVPPFGDNIWKMIFDLADLDADACTFSIMDYAGSTGKSTQVAGVSRSISAGTGFTYDTDRWECAAISASTYVYLTLEREDATATINRGSTLPDGDDDTEIHPLWYIPFADSKITGSGIVDMRTTVRLPAMA